MEKKINIGIVGAGFGGDFSEIYNAHPNVASVSICDIDKAKAEAVKNRLGLKRRYDTFEEMIKDPEIDAVHILTPFPLHEEMSEAALSAGKHCACAVPMALTAEGVKKIVAAARKSGKNYMLMETAAYTYQFLLMKGMKEAGQFGRIQYMHGTHHQELTSLIPIQKYWEGVPPMLYMTHGISPLRLLADCDVKTVYGVGSGTVDKEHTKIYGYEKAYEAAIITFENGISATLDGSRFNVAKMYQEGVDIYGSEQSFEWGKYELDPATITRFIDRPDCPKALHISEYTTVYPGARTDLYPPELFSFWHSHHHGSHPHLVHEFVSSIIEKRKSALDEDISANISLTGIMAHTSAVNGGEIIQIEKP